MKKTFYLIRHGVTPWNKGEKCMGQQDIALDEEGLRQSEALADTFEHIPLERVLCSDLIRTRQTAAPLAARHGVEPELDPRLREINYGELEGTSPSDWPTLFPELMKTWNFSSVDQAPPGGESRGELITRCSAALEGCLRHDARHTAIVTHGGVIMGLLTWAVFHSVGEPARHSLGLFKVHNASITTLSNKEGRWRIESVNHPPSTL